ncbi:MAG: outer membrane beta-barrel protein [Acidobacteria bacterium]|nr:outer membrane beta-barrel protein [Acidobacteriota bacterium]
MPARACAQAPVAADATAEEDKTSADAFFQRLFHFYKKDWSETSASTQQPARRLPLSPLDSPPFPSADWPYGGSPIIGARDTNTYPLMEAINGDTSRTKIYGWIEPGFNFTTSKRVVYPMSYNIYANQIELDQAVIYLERLPDTVQTDHFDWGFHVTGFYGVDYRFTTSVGYFSQQLLKFNRQYGFDPVLEYIDLYFPQIAEGMNIRIGRYISVPGIEAQLAPANYSYTHSLLFTTDPFTQSGALATIRLNKKWLLQAGIQASNDTAPWADDAKPSLTACISYTTPPINDNLYVCANGINDGHYGYNNVQHYDATWYHKFSARTHIATEAWYMYEREVPNITSALLEKPGANPAFCLPSELRCFAPEWAVTNYLERDFSKQNYLSIRNEFLDDIKGQRTGFKTRYSEHEFMYGHWIGSTIVIRPGIRFERAYDTRAYNSGARHNQLSFTTDLIFKF